MKRAISSTSRQRFKFWEEHLRQWQESGLSQTGYCRTHGLSDKSFVYWKKRIAAAGVTVSLVEVPRFQAMPVQPSNQPLRLMVGNRYGIEIERDFDEQTLDRLLRVLEER
jgi:transposase